MAAWGLSLANAGVLGTPTNTSDAATPVVPNGWYWIVIAGGQVTPGLGGTSVNFGAAATASMPTLGPGAYGPFQLNQSGVGDNKMHAIALAAGRVDLVPAPLFGAT
jgi:hypothetical protein